jgi:hypothetical protein
LLSRAHELLNAAAEQGLPKISGRFARQYFENQAPPTDVDDHTGLDESVDDIDDLLLSRG